MKNATIEGFVNAQLMKFYYPQTFYAPTIEEIMKLQEGDWVKVCHKSERLWCKFITWGNDNKSMFVEVDNELIFSEHPFNLGDSIEVYVHHLFDIRTKEEKWDQESHDVSLHL
jgi:hypothetical protein